MMRAREVHNTHFFNLQRCVNDGQKHACQTFVFDNLFTIIYHFISGMLLIKMNINIMSNTNISRLCHNNINIIIHTLFCCSVIQTKYY